MILNSSKNSSDKICKCGAKADKTSFLSGRSNPICNNCISAFMKKLRRSLTNIK